MSLEADNVALDRIRNAYKSHEIVEIVTINGDAMHVAIKIIPGTKRGSVLAGAMNYARAGGAPSEQCCAGFPLYDFGEAIHTVLHGAYATRESEVKGGPRVPTDVPAFSSQEAILGLLTEDWISFLAMHQKLKQDLSSPMQTQIGAGEFIAMIMRVGEEDAKGLIPFVLSRPSTLASSVHTLIKMYLVSLRSRLPSGTPSGPDAASGKPRDAEEMGAQMVTIALSDLLVVKGPG